MIWMIVGAFGAAYALLLGLLVWLAGYIARRCGVNAKVWRWGSLGVFLVISAVFFAWKWFVNPLPSDEYMIEHLGRNKAAYEELIAGYVDAQSKGNDAMKIWLGSPRKIELQRLVKAKDEMVNPESSQWYGGIIPHSRSGEMKKIIYALEFRIEDGNAILFRENSVVWKSYWYFPIPPELTEYGFCRNNDKAEKCLNKSNTGVLNSLNDHPVFPDSEDGCGDYVRQIDAHWFIRYVKGCF